MNGRRCFERQLNTLLVIIALAVIAWLVCGCRSHKTVIDESHNTAFVDTTKVEADSLAQTTTSVDTTKTTTETENSAAIEFVDGGGTVTIDSAGNMTLSGVKSIKGNIKHKAKEEKGISQVDESVSTHSSRHGGLGIIESDERHVDKESKAEAPKWYQHILAKIGGLCCIAALIYALFLYLKRKF